MEKIITTVWIAFGIYILVGIMIFADLWSGVRKARRMGAARTSYGYRRTVSKIAQYYNVLIALSVVDTLQMSAIWYLERFYNYQIPLFPIVTLIGAILLCFIEIKSIYEKAEDKERMRNAASLAGKIIENRQDISDIVKEVLQYMNETKKD